MFFCLEDKLHKNIHSLILSREFEAEIVVFKYSLLHLWDNRYTYSAVRHSEPKHTPETTSEFICHVFILTLPGFTM